MEHTGKEGLRRATSEHLERHEEPEVEEVAEAAIASGVDVAREFYHRLGEGLERAHFGKCLGFGGEDFYVETLGVGVEVAEAVDLTEYSREEITPAEGKPSPQKGCALPVARALPELFHLLLQTL